MASIRIGIGESMEDRYLYKAKTTPKEKGEFNNVWVTGNLIVSNGKYYIHPVGNVVNVKNETGRIIVMHEVIPDTICQCTGLKDKNGKLIWENDIISYQIDNDDCPFPNKDTKKRFGKVFYKGFRTTFAIGMGKNGSGSINDDLWKYVQNGNRVEVNGNRFDNPELLESGE